MVINGLYVHAPFLTRESQGKGGGGGGLVWCIPAAVAEVVPVGSETSWAPLVARSRAVESRQNQPPASQTADGKTNNRLCRFSKWRFALFPNGTRFHYLKRKFYRFNCGFRSACWKALCEICFFWQRYASLLLGFFDLDWIIGPTWTQPR